MFFEGYTEKLWGRHPRDISAEWGAQRVKGLSISAVIKDMCSKILPKSKNRQVETSLIEEFIYPKFGPGQLWETVAAEIEDKGGRLLKNCQVTSLTRKDNRISGVVYEHDGKPMEIEGDFVISSMPIKDLVAGLGDAVPDTIQRVASGLPYRDFVTVGLLVNKLNLENKTAIPTLGNIVPDCWIYVQDIGVKLGRIQIFNNWSPYLVKDPEHTVWIGLEYFCEEGDDFWRMPEEDCVAFAIKELISMGILTQARMCLTPTGSASSKPIPLILIPMHRSMSFATIWTASKTCTAWAGMDSIGTTTWIIPWQPPLKRCAVS